MLQVKNAPSYESWIDRHPASARFCAMDWYRRYDAGDAAVLPLGLIFSLCSTPAGGDERWSCWRRVEVSDEPNVSNARARVTPRPMDASVRVRLSAPPRATR